MDDGARAEDDTRPDDGQRSHVNVRTQARRGMDHGCRMDSGDRPCLRMQQRRRARIGEVWVRRQEAGQRRLDRGGEDDGGGPRGGEAGRVLAVGDEGQVAGPGILDAGHAVYFDRAVPPQRAAEPVRQVAEDHPVASPLAAGAWAAPAPTLTAPFSTAPSRTERPLASTPPSTRAFSSRISERVVRFPLNEPAISTVSAVTFASTRAP